MLTKVRQFAAPLVLAGSAVAPFVILACSAGSGSSSSPGSNGSGASNGTGSAGNGTGATGAGANGAGASGNAGTGSGATGAGATGAGATGAGATGSGASTGIGGSSGSAGGGVTGQGGTGVGTGGTVGTLPDGGLGGAGGSTAPTGPIAVTTTPGIWRTALNTSTGRFGFIAPDGTPTVLHGISTTGLETGTRETGSGGGFWLFASGQGNEATNAPTVLGNVISTLTTNWKTTVVRIPICGSAWAQNYQVHDYGNAAVKNYHDWVDLAVQKARAAGAVVLIDNHLWAIAKMGNGGGVDRGSFVSNGVTHKYSEYEDGCTGINKTSGVDSCAPSDWYTSDPSTWECAIANADGVSMYNAYYNKDKISSMWEDIANHYKGDSGVWFEVFNEPYARKAPNPFPAAGVNEDDSEYPWDLWSAYMMEQIQAIRDKAQASNIILVNGLDFGYDFGPRFGPIAYPQKYLPWTATYPNIAYAFHPYQHGSCCGQIGASGTDQSATDPYESGFCSYYADGTTWGAASGTNLPGGKTCTNNGYASTQDKKMPPCTWVDTAYNPATKSAGLCAGDRGICNPMSKAQCQAVDQSSPAAGGWSEYVLPMARFGPLIATEFGSFDCSSGFVKTLLKYTNQFDISYTAWALWPQNSGGPAGLGACGYPSVMTSSADPGDFHTCLDASTCSSLMKPLPWAGQATFDDLMSH